MNNVFFCALFILTMGAVGCGVKGDPTPILPSEKIGDGIPRAKRFKRKAETTELKSTTLDQEAADEEAQE